MHILLFLSKKSKSDMEALFTARAIFTTQNSVWNTPQERMMSEDYRLQYLQMDAAPQRLSHEKWPYSVELKEHLWYGNKNITPSSKLHDVMQELYLLNMQTIASPTPVKWTQSVKWIVHANIHQRICLEWFGVVKWCLICAYFCHDSTFSLPKAILWIEELYCWTVWPHSDGTHSL